ncbi:hypothetical protein [Lentibacillus sp.]|uniref:hypothetical protein n=1 Tax=Lentibacillus sp. TaxID=1925746 RepID=UPI002B4AB8D1|nr:hypothetical protein [Lentibacillus sp.]HLS10479.1 hypothetical protein [Lentibacillus sp.]
MTNETDILIYQTEDGNTKIDVRLENETVWMTQKAIAELYQKGVNTINEHIKNIYAEGELHESAFGKTVERIREDCGWQYCYPGV